MRPEGYLVFIPIVILIVILIFSIRQRKLNNKKREELKELLTEPSTLLPKGAIDDINSGKLPVFDSPTEIMLTKGELCHYVDSATLVTTRSIATEQYSGMVFITNKRIIFRSLQQGFDNKLSKLTSIVPIPGGLQLQFGSRFLSLLTPLPESFFLTIKLLTYEV